MGTVSNSNNICCLLMWLSVHVGTWILSAIATTIWSVAVVVSTHVGTWVLSAIATTIWSVAVVGSTHVGTWVLSAISNNHMVCAVVGNIGDMGTVSNVATTAYGHVLWLATLTVPMSPTVDSNSNRPYGLLLWLSTHWGPNGYCQQ